MDILDGGKFFERMKNFFREVLSEVIGAYFDGMKIFVVRLTDTLLKILRRLNAFNKM